jgi:subtilisin family serine protease
MLRPVKVFSTDTIDPGVTEDEISDGIDWAWLQGAEVMSNSWHFVSRTPFECIDQSYLDARTLGREGKGCIVVFAAGNRGDVGIEYPSRLVECIAVGATNLNDSILGFSAWDTVFTVDLVAPSDSTNARGHVWACDQMGNEGYNRQNGLGMHGLDVGDTAWNCPDGDDLDYNCAFGGTSAAAPLVAGVAALILSKDSTLTVDEVESIMYGSAVRPVGMGTPPQVPHIKYGYGRVDAFRAILSISHGDLNQNGDIDLTDLSILIAYLTVTPKPTIFPSKALADWNCSDNIDISDLSLLLAHLYYSGSGPTTPCFKFGLQ